MTTTETTVSLQVSCKDLWNLFNTGLICAGKDPTLPMLACVRLEVHGTELVAVSTDRFRLGVARIPITNMQGDLDAFEALIPAGDMKNALPMLKVFPSRDWRATTVVLKLSGKKLEWERSDGMAGTLPNVVADYSFPKWRHLIRPAAQRPLSDDHSHFACTAEYLAAFAKAVWDKHAGQTMVVEAGESPSRPILVRVGTHFIGLLMPVRKSDEVDASRESWDMILEGS